MVELIGVIVLIGILSVVALPRFFNSSTYAARTFYDSTLVMLRYAQKIAIAQQPLSPSSVTVQVKAATNTICLSYAVADTTCATAVLNPANRQPFQLVATGGVTIGPTTSFSFSSSGALTSAAPVTLTITGGGTVRTITVEPQTGYVH